MSVRKKWMVFLMVLCIAVTIASVASLTVPVAAKEPSGPVYVLRDNSGRLALYDAENGSLLRQYDVYTHLLPAVDVDMLRAGIDIYSDDQLQRLIEAYGA